MPFTQGLPLGVNTPALLLCAGLLQRVVEWEGGEEPFRGSGIRTVELQFWSLVNGLTHHGQGRHTHDSLNLSGKRRLLRETEHCLISCEPVLSVGT